MCRSAFGPPSLRLLRTNYSTGKLPGTVHCSTVICHHLVPESWISHTVSSLLEPAISTRYEYLYEYSTVRVFTGEEASHLSFHTSTPEGALQSRRELSLPNRSRTLHLQATVPPYSHRPSSGFLHLASHAPPTTLLHALHQPTPTTLQSSPLLSTQSIPTALAPTPRGTRIHRHQANFETRGSTLLTHIISTARAVAHYCTRTRPAAPLTSRLPLIPHR